MNILDQHIPTVQKHITEFLHSQRDTRAQVRLVNGLQTLENTIRRELGAKDKQKGLWVRFHHNDTLATSIQNLKTAIVPQKNTERNYTYMMENLIIAAQPNSGLQINFS